jgi:integrase
MATVNITQNTVRAAKPKAKPYDIRDKQTTGFILRVLPAKKDNTFGRLWYVEVSRAKRHKIGDATILTPTQGRNKAKRILRGEDPDEVLKKVSKGGLTLKAFLSDAEHETEQRYGYWVKHNRRTGDAILTRLKVCFEKRLGNHQLKELTPAVLERWITDRKKAGIKPETINRDVGALKAALAKAVDWKLIPEQEHPLKKLAPLKTDKKKKKQRAFTKEEEERVFAELEAREARMRAERDSHNEWRRARHREPLPSLEERYTDHLLPACLIARHTGVRKNELLNMKWSWVDLEAKIITLPASITKSQETEDVYLNETALRVLKRWKLQSGPGALVFNNQGKPFTSFKKAFYRVVKDAGIDRTAGNKGNIVWHSWRHTFGTRLIKAKVPVHEVKELMRHEDIKTTMQYVHPEDEDLAAAVLVLDQQH